MSEADVVRARELFTLEMIRIRTDLMLANPEDSDIEAEGLEALEEAEAVVLEKHDVDLGSRMDEDQVHDADELKARSTKSKTPLAPDTRSLANTSSAPEGSDNDSVPSIARPLSATNSAVDLGLDPDRFEIMSSASGPADSEGLLSEGAEEFEADDEAEEHDVDAPEENEVAEVEMAEEEMGVLPVPTADRSDLPDPGEDNSRVNKTGPWLPPSGSKPKLSNPFARGGPVGRFGPMGAQSQYSFCPNYSLIVM